MEYSEYQESVVFEIVKQSDLSYGEADSLLSSFSLDFAHYEKIYFPEELAKLVLHKWNTNTQRILEVIRQ